MFGITCPESFSSPRPSARPRPSPPVQPRKKPTICQSASRPRHPGITGSPLKWQPKNQRSGFTSSSARTTPLPYSPPVSEISATGGEYGKGVVRAELEVNPDLWFFGCHFKGDPVMPGCLGLDALWQLVGFYLGWTGGEGRGRALGLGELKLAGQVLPNVRKIVYNIDIKRVMRSKLVLGIADGWLSMDGEIIYRAKDLKVGLFKQGTAPV